MRSPSASRGIHSMGTHAYGGAGWRRHGGTSWGPISSKLTPFPLVHTARLRFPASSAAGRAWSPYSRQGTTSDQSHPQLAHEDLLCLASPFSSFSQQRAPKGVAQAQYGRGAGHWMAWGKTNLHKNARIRMRCQLVLR